MTLHKMLTPDQLVAELQTLVAELSDEAAGGSYPAREWLLWAFPGHRAYFRNVWANGQGVQNGKRKWNGATAAALPGNNPGQTGGA